MKRNIIFYVFLISLILLFSDNSATLLEQDCPLARRQEVSCDQARRDISYRAEATYYSVERVLEVDFDFTNSGDYWYSMEVTIYWGPRGNVKRYHKRKSIRCHSTHQKITFHVAVSPRDPVLERGLGSIVRWKDCTFHYWDHIDVKIRD